LSGCKSEREEAKEISCIKGDDPEMGEGGQAKTVLESQTKKWKRHRLITLALREAPDNLTEVRDKVTRTK
jgi:hypothetical protein